MWAWGSLWGHPPIKGQISTGGVTRATENLEASPLEAETWWFSREGRETIPEHSGYPYMNLAPYHQRPERRGCWLHALHYLWPALSISSCHYVMYQAICSQEQGLFSLLGDG